MCPALMGASFNKEENLHTRLVLGSHNASRSAHLPMRILSVYMRALMGFSHIQCLDGLDNALFSQAFLLEVTPAVGTVGTTCIPRAREGTRSL